MNEVLDTSSKTRKALMFEEVPDAECETDTMPTELKDVSEKKGNEADSTLEEPAPYTEDLQGEDLTMEEGEFSNSDLQGDAMHILLLILII